MFLLILLVIIVSVALPILLTWLYARWVSPLHKYPGLRQVPGTYMVLLVTCAIVPLVGAALFNYIELRIDMDTWWPMVFGGAIVMCSICMDGALSLARHKKRLIVVALPYLLIAGFSTAAALLMLALVLDPNPRLF